MESFSIGTGASIYTQKLIPAILGADHEIILVTCYWAQSKTLDALRDALEHLARRRASQRRAAASATATSTTPKLRVRICFSSRSLLQKLFHTSSSEGHDCPASTWEAKLGLPSPEVLAAGAIDLRVRSLFFLPFSVMHPKFLVVDRRRAFVPSCNVSWEPWLEACLELARCTPAGDAIDGLLDFYRGVWERDLDLAVSLPPSPEPAELSGPHVGSILGSPADSSVRLSGIADVPPGAVEWLPSWHHRNPRFCIFPWQTPRPPDTPLNNALLRLFAEASREIYIQTPNVTSHPVLSAVMDALSRGVDVTIVTSRRMMVWEQLLTAGTTAERCIRGLTRRHSQLCESAQASTHGPSARPGGHAMDVEAQPVRPGALRIYYFHPVPGSTAQEEPVQSHVKLTIFDGAETVLGSGNMDRASWFTSQELGILVRSAAFATAVQNVADQALQGRVKLVYP